jgi:hypothetical protein
MTALGRQEIWEDSPVRYRRSPQVDVPVFHIDLSGKMRV